METFRLLDKYRPETKQQKKARLAARAAERAKGKEDQPTKRPPGMSKNGFLCKSEISMQLRKAG